MAARRAQKSWAGRRAGAHVFPPKKESVPMDYKYAAPNGAVSRSALNVFQLFPSEFVFDISRVERGRRFKQQHFAFFFGKRTMFYATRDDDEFARLNPFAAFGSTLTIVHPKTALHYQKHLIFSFMMMPGERPLKFYELNQLPIEFAGDARIPMILNERKFLGEIDLVHFKWSADILSAGREHLARGFADRQDAGDPHAGCVRS